MTRVRVEGFTISLDGYGAGPNQDIGNPLGVGGTDLHQWLTKQADRSRESSRTAFCSVHREPSSAPHGKKFE